MSIEVIEKPQQESTTSALVLVEAMTPAKLFEPGAIDPLLDRIKAEVRSVKKDISTEKGRKAIASLAYKISRTKTFIDDQRLSLVSDEKKRLARIDAEGKRVREELDALRDEFRQPLTDWENAEKTRIKGHEDALQAMENIKGVLSAMNLSSAGIQDLLVLLGSKYSRHWQEFALRAQEVEADVHTALDKALVNATKREAEAAELVRLRREAEERAQKERDERIAREAREKAEREAKEREEAAARAAEAERQRIEREAAEREAAIRREAEEQARRDREARQMAEREAQEREAAIERERQAAEERARKAEANRLAAEQKAQRDAEEAARRAEEARLAAIRAERERAEREQKAADEAKAKRYAVTVDHNIGTVTISLRMAQQLVNSLLLHGYADNAIEDLEAFVSKVGDTPEIVVHGKAAIKALKNGWSIQ